MEEEAYSGQTIKDLLKKHGVSVKEVAKRLHQSEQSVYEVLRKDHIRFNTLLKFYYALGLKNADGTEDIKENFNYEKDKYIMELKGLIAEQSATIAVLAQSNLSLIEQMGKFPASESLAGHYA